MSALLPHALAGTGNHPPDDDLVTPVDGVVGDVAAAGGDEMRLLLRAGALAAYRRAGTEPGIERLPLPEPAEPDTASPCTPAAARLVGGLLAGEHPALLHEAVALLAGANQRLPPALLPELLDVAGAEALPGLPAVLGSRGRWLARFRDEWTWAREGSAPDTAEEARIWEEGSLPARLAVLRRRRAVDPEAARACVASALPKERADARAEILEALREGLAAGDEPLLERALDDRSAIVRAAAAGLLARLPGSALGERMRARCDACLVFERPALRAEAPAASAAAEPAWERDGIVAKAPQGVGERAHLLAQITGFVPPDRWSELAGIAPADVVELVAGNAWEGALLAGIAGASLRHDAVAWMEPVVRALAALPPDAWPLRLRLEMEVELLARMPGAAALRMAADAIADASRDAVVLAGFRRRRDPWDEPLSSALLQAAERQESLELLRRLAPWLALAALRLPPAAFARALAVPSIPDATDHLTREWNASLASFQEAIRLRQRLREEIQP